MPLMEELRAQFGIEYPLQLISTSTRQQVPLRPPPLQSSSSGPSRSPSMSSGIPPRPPPPPQQYYDPNSRRISQGDSLEYGNSQGIPPRPSYPPSTTGSPEVCSFPSTFEIIDKLNVVVFCRFSKLDMDLRFLLINHN